MGNDNKQSLKMKYTKEELPPIIKAFGKLEEASVDDSSDDVMYFTLAMSKTN